MINRSLFKPIYRILYGIVSLPAILIEFLRQVAIWISSERWYLCGFIPCSAGLWPLGLYCWEKRIERRPVAILMRLLGIVCLILGTFLFVAGLWRLAGILFLIRIPIWLDRWLHLGETLYTSEDGTPSSNFSHPLDRLSLWYIGIIFLVLAINKERLLEFGDPSDHYYHMAVAQKILETGTIPIWDDWEFAPVGRPHLYPPLLHLLIALFAGSPDHIVEGFSNIQMLLFPSTLLAYWYFFRTLFPPAHAYISLLVLSMEYMFSLGCLMGLPSSLVNLLWPLILVAILKKKTYLATVYLAIAFYTHTGIPMLIGLCLLILGIWKRDLLRSVLITIVGALILSIPWTLRYYVFADWMHTSGSQGFSLASIVTRLLWLQIINPIFLILTVWGWFRLKDTGVIKSQVIGFLPMLTQYGGRFFMHGAPFLSPFIASHFTRFLEGTITRRRAVCFLLMTIIPLPSINFLEAQDQIKPSLFVNITAPHICLFFTLNRQWKNSTELDTLMQVIQETTSTDDIIHLPADEMYHFGDYVVVMTGRRTDMGGWGEVTKPEMWETIMKCRKDPRDGIFVSRFRENIPKERRIEQSGTFFIGYPSDEEISASSFP